MTAFPSAPHHDALTNERRRWQIKNTNIVAIQNTNSYFHDKTFGQWHTENTKHTKQLPILLTRWQKDERLDDWTIEQTKTEQDHSIVFVVAKMAVGSMASFNEVNSCRFKYAGVCLLAHCHSLPRRPPHHHPNVVINWASLNPVFRFWTAVFVIVESPTARHRPWWLVPHSIGTIKQWNIQIFIEYLPQQVF